MRHLRACFLRKFSRWTLTALLLLAGAGIARAQVPVYDSVDWLLDRGSITFFGATNNARPLRQGYNDFTQTVLALGGNPDPTAPGNNNPGHAVRRWVWPFTRDLGLTNATDPLTGAILNNEIIDNRNDLDPNNSTDTNNTPVRVQPPPPAQAGNNPQQMAHNFLTGFWTLPEVPVGDPNDYRAPALGFSFNGDPSQPYDYDYAYGNAVHDDFQVDPGNGQTRPASIAELSMLPYAPSYVYNRVNTDLKTTITKSTWESGTYNLPVGSYSIDIYSPGSGTIINTVVTPNVQHAFVRVSWKNTVTPFGTPNPAGVNDPVNSRIFMIDLSQSGWIHIQGDGLAPPAFPLDGNPADQIVVTLYTLTPDNLNDPNTYAVPPVVTADAVRFNLVSFTGTAALGPIGASGRILGPAVGTNKFRPANFPTVTDVQPLTYVAREESVPDPTPRIAQDPTQPVSKANPLVPDPSAVATVPVFYCLDNQNGDVVDAMNNPITSLAKVRWRYVGQPDASQITTSQGTTTPITLNGSGTSSASPLLANVRCRDGMTRAMLFFETTNGDGTIGHIYALDPVGSRVTQSTSAFWVYPSYRPLTAAELATNDFPIQYHDPNYNNFNPGDPAVYPVPTFGPDLAIPYKDGDLIPNPVAPAEVVVRTDTQAPFGGVQSSPVVIDDPDNAGGAQVLVFGNMNGRVYALDAGGRGDFSATMAGTTQRYWTWPHVKADAYHIKYPNGVGVTPNPYVDEPAKGTGFAASPAFDPDYAGGNLAQTPVIIGAGDTAGNGGNRMYAINPGHDVFKGFFNNQASFQERQNWVYPALDSRNDLGSPPGTAAIFQPTGGGPKLLYFTAGGFAYCLPEVPTAAGTPPLVNTLSWVFPFSPNPPNADPNNENNGPLAPGFNGATPVVISQAMLNTAPAGTPPPLATQDTCYVTNSDGTVFALSAIRTGMGGGPASTTVIATGQSLTGGATGASPIGTLIQGLPGLSDDTTTSVPTLVFADNDGAIWGLGARPVDDGTGTGTLILPVLWAHNDSVNSRPASASLANGMIVEGDENGQLHAYGVGTGNFGLGETVGVGEPAERSFGAGHVSIDLRVLDVFQQGVQNPANPNQAGYRNFMLSTNPQNGYVAWTPGRTNTGAAFGMSANPLPGNIAPNTSTAVAIDWGDHLFIAAWGVYHAQPSDNMGNRTRGTGPPIIHVYFRITQPNGQALTPMVTVPLVTHALHAGNNGGNPELWPDDLGMTNAEKDGLQIYGIDNNGIGMGDDNPRQLTGRDDNVYPWVARYALPISPTANAPFVPGEAGYTVTAYATIEQPLARQGMAQTTMETQTSNTLRLGQHDYPGLNGPPAVPGGPVFPVSPNNIGVLGRQRRVFIANPLALTVRGYIDQNNVINGNGPIADMTGQSNIVGWAGVLTPQTLNDAGELLNNGNRRLNPLVPRAGVSAIKALYAPVPMTAPNSTGTYTGVDGAGNQITALVEVMDRSNLKLLTGQPLRVQVLTKPLRWLGFSSQNGAGIGSAVMNPLPWEQLPTDGQDTKDYPNIGPQNLSVTRTDTGQDVINAEAPLIPPVYPGANPDPATRLVQPTPLSLTVHVPQYQPANVNRGIVSYTDPNTGNSYSWGSPFMDISGTLRGGPAAGNSPILGPIRADTGNPVDPTVDPAVLTRQMFPAAGYTADAVVRVVPPGEQASNGTRGSRPFNPDLFFTESRNAVGNPVQQAFRAFSLGLTVPPSMKMRVAEQTLDIGKQPMGAGYSDLVTGNYRLPFSPNGSSDYPRTNNPFVSSPWDDQNKLGTLFLPFTLFNESNVNLIDVRVAKLLGQFGAAISPLSLAPNSDPTAGNPPGTAAASRLISDQVNNLSISPLYAVPFAGPGVGNIGIISSFDHISSSSGKIAERPLWPLANPFVRGVDINAAVATGALLPTANDIPHGIMGWADQIQPQPTVGKPRVGDTQGRRATVPDKPHDAPDDPFFGSPEVGVAIPFGTPIGTYSNPIFVYEDNTPLQWREWLAASNSGATLGADRDDILNVTTTGQTTETHADPTFSLVVHVREARLTEGSTFGNLAMIDRGMDLQPAPQFPGPSVLPSAYMVPGPANTPLARNLFLYWSTNRQPTGSPFLINPALNPPGAPRSDAPWNLAFSAIPAPYTNNPIVRGDFGFGRGGNGLNLANVAWWTQPSLFKGLDGGGNPATSAYLFPSTQAEQAAATVGAYVPPILPGNRVAQTERHSSPAVVSVLSFANGYGAPDPNDRETYLFWPGQIDKTRAVGAGGPQVTQRDTRTFWTAAFSANDSTLPGVPTGPTFALLNDPALPKLSPKPLLLKLPARNGFPAIKLLYLFWHAGSTSQTALYYNVNGSTSLNAPLPGNGWSKDQKLPAPNALVWESDPYPTYRHFRISGNDVDAIDVSYTGVLKNRQTVEILLSRYQINRADGSLSLMPLPTAVGETLTREGATDTYLARDAGWAQGTGPAGSIGQTDLNSVMFIYVQSSANAAPVLVNAVPASNPAVPQRGQFDPASGLVYYDSSMGGQIVVDTRSGAIRFPQVPPKRSDIVLATYTPYVMRLNTSRDESNIDRTQVANFGNFGPQDRAFLPKPAITSAGNNTNPVVVFDRGLNPRAALTAPQVVFPNGATPTIDRMWVLYRKSDPSGSAKSTIYYKSMRLMVKLPRPVALGAPNANGLQQFAAPVTVGGNLGPYEVDWVRGRIYFTEIDEGSLITVNYSFTDPATGNPTASGGLTYRVAWGDEPSAASTTGDDTTPEVIVPTDSAVNEGQITAFKDPFLDKLWIFWTSTRASTTDLYSETIAPQFYPTASNQH